MKDTSFALAVIPYGQTGVMHEIITLATDCGYPLRTSPMEGAGVGAVALITVYCENEVDYVGLVIRMRKAISDWTF